MNLKDKKFDKDFTDGRDEHFYGYLWEMLLADHLHNLGFKLSSSDVGPDFLLDIDGCRVWIEATCPSPSGIPDYWLSPPSIEEIPAVNSFPHEAITLRWTSAIADKKQKLDGFKADERVGEGYLKKGLVELHEPYIIALSSCRLGSIPLLLTNGISQLPFAVEAVFPVGPLQVTINTDTGQMVNIGPSLRASIKKPSNDAEVPTDSFLHHGYKHVSAVIGSNAGVNAACGDKSTLIVVHNPLAVNPAPVGVWGADQEYIAEDKVDHYELRNILA